MPNMASALDKSPSFHVSVVACLLAQHLKAWQLGVCANVLDHNKNRESVYFN